MNIVIPTPATPGGKAGPQKANHIGEIVTYEDFAQFGAVVQEAGVSIDFPQLISINTSLVVAGDGYLLLSLRHFDVPESFTILLLKGEKAILYSKVPPRPEAIQVFSRLFTKHHGLTTAVAYLVLKQAVTNYEVKLDSLIASVRELEGSFDFQRSRTISLELEQLMDRLEDFQAILIKIEDTNLKEVETRYISFDYGVLLAEAGNLVDRCRRRFNVLKDLVRDYEVQATNELNRRIERLNDVVKKLTAVTVILMIPTLIASHFGMNFTRMPELGIAWAYPTVVVGQFVLVAAGVVLFKKIGWL